MIQRPSRTTLLALAAGSLCLASLLLIGWLALSLYSQNPSWEHFVKAFAAELVLIRSTVYAGLLTGWVGCLRRVRNPERRALLLQAGLITLTCIVLIEINRLRG